jgi:hypothetical protein
MTTNSRVPEMGDGMQVVYERKDSYDINSGPFGYVKVGFRWKDEITWFDVHGSYFDNKMFTEREAFVKELVRRWNKEAVHDAE